MSPSDAHSSLAALRQLQELLDAGTITPPEFEALKRQLIFGAEPPASPTAIPTPPAPPEAALPSPEPAALADDAQLLAALSSPAPDWLAAAAPSLLAYEDAPTPPPSAERRNPLNIIFIVGGILVLFGLVAYLTLERQPPSEHLTSASQTAADSTAVVPEVGPQAEQITLPPTAAPETVRVAPVVRAVAPVVQAPSVADSVVAAPAVAPVRPAPAVSVKSAVAPAPTVKAAPVAVPAAVDSAGRP
ncbi:SHOCT domain-containing protein [Hymenobacter psoromatis]|uniref:SHOCT domain-containing protein n=1 Tax=Hymenobacter psoromatis TaxID=1484116 RepID=UPI001CBC7149|nr:SHOCT domain-containing protein [Hymenobacter psoromatis]